MTTCQPHQPVCQPAINSVCRQCGRQSKAAEKQADYRMRETAQGGVDVSESERDTDQRDQQRGIGQ